MLLRSYNLCLHLGSVPYLPKVRSVPLHVLSRPVGFCHLTPMPASWFCTVLAKGEIPSTAYPAVSSASVITHTMHLSPNSSMCHCTYYVCILALNLTSVSGLNVTDFKVLALEVHSLNPSLHMLSLHFVSVNAHRYDHNCHDALGRDLGKVDMHAYICLTALILSLDSERVVVSGWAGL